METHEGTRPGSGGLELHTVVWSPPPGEPTRADVVLVHGYGEHSGRYSPVARRLTSAGLRVSAVDHRGHGRSKGLARGELDSFDALVDDLAGFVDDVRSDLPLFLYGHSMGALATVRLAERGDSTMAGLVLTGAALSTSDSIPKILVKAANFLGSVAPRLRTIALDGAAISRDAAVREDYDSDPLNFRGRLTARTGKEMNLAMGRALDDAHLIHVPMLVMHGTADALAAPSGSERLVGVVSSDDVTYKPWPGAFHELHHEPERDEVISTIVSWISSHLDR